jgi:hypothetical protein
MFELPKLLVTLSLFVAFALSPRAHALDPHLAMEPSAKARLGEMASKHITLVGSTRNGNLFSADASAVLKVDAAKLFAAALDYDHYVKFGMPHLNESHLVERASPDLLYVFSSLTYNSLNSRQYMEVRVHRTLDVPGAMGIEWEKTPKRANWPYADNNAFNRTDGTFYVQPLADGNTYVRYYLSNNVDLPMLGVLSGIIQRALRGGASDVIMVLANQAPVQHN